MAVSNQRLHQNSADKEQFILNNSHPLIRWQQLVSVVSNMNIHVYKRMTNIKTYVYKCIGTITINTSLDNPIILLRYQATLPYQDPALNQD